LPEIVLPHRRSCVVRPSDRTAQGLRRMTGRTRPICRGTVFSYVLYAFGFSSAKDTQKLDFAVRISLFIFAVTNKNTMKLIKSIFPLMAGLSLLASCEKNNTETVSYTPTHIIVTDGDGVNLYKSEYSYYSSNEAFSRKLYKWKESSWELTNEYGYKYSYGQNNVLLNYSVTDNGQPLYREDYEYDTNDLCKCWKRTEYSGSEETTTEYRFFYDTENYHITVKYVFAPDTVGKWKEYAKEEYEYDSDGNNTKVIASLVVDEKYVESAVSEFKYSDRALSNSVEWEVIGGVKKKYRTVDYAYDQHGRNITKTTVTFNLEADPVTSTKTIEHIYYKD